MLCYLHRKEATAVYAGVLRVCWAYCAGVLIGVFHEAFLTGGMGYSQLSWACPFLSSVGRLFFSSKNIFSLGGSQRARRECDVFLPFLSSSWRRLVVFSVFLCFPPIFHHMKYDRTMNLLPPLGRGKQKKNPSTIFCFCESSLHARTRPPFFFFRFVRCLVNGVVARGSRPTFRPSCLCCYPHDAVQQDVEPDPPLPAPLLSARGSLWNCPVRRSVWLLSSVSLSSFFNCAAFVFCATTACSFRRFCASAYLSLAFTEMLDSFFFFLSFFFLVPQRCKTVVLCVLLLVWVAGLLGGSGVSVFISFLPRTVSYDC